MSETAISATPPETGEQSQAQRFLRRLTGAHSGLIELFLNDADFELHRLTCWLPDPHLPANAEAIALASRQLIELAADMARYWQVPLQRAYADRLAEIEARDAKKLAKAGDQLGAQFLAVATNWTEAKDAQSLHDRYFHKQVIDWSPPRQFRHHALHVGKLLGRLAEAIGTQDYTAMRQTFLPDILAFGVILANLVEDNLDDPELPFSLIAPSG